MLCGDITIEMVEQEICLSSSALGHVANTVGLQSIHTVRLRKLLLQCVVSNISLT